MNEDDFGSDPEIEDESSPETTETVAEVTETEVVSEEKTLSNTDVNKAQEQVGDLEVFGDGDTFKLICKASSKAEGWMKSTKAMEIPRIGCVIQVTTQQDGEIAEALTFVPAVCIKEDRVDGVVVNRSIVRS